MATLYNADGSTVKVSPANGRAFTLAELQALVGGFIELVPGTAQRPALCNEEGRLARLPFNDEASRRFGMDLVGNVVECDTRIESGDDGEA